MTVGQLCQLLENIAKEYRTLAIDSIKQNNHMHECKEKHVKQDIIDATLVDYINYVAQLQGINLGLYLKDLKNER